MEGRVSSSLRKRNAGGLIADCLSDDKVLSSSFDGEGTPTKVIFSSLGEETRGQDSLLSPVSLESQGEGLFYVIEMRKAEDVATDKTLLLTPGEEGRRQTSPILSSDEYHRGLRFFYSL